MTVRDLVLLVHAVREAYRMSVWGEDEEFRWAADGNLAGLPFSDEAILQIESDNCEVYEYLLSTHAHRVRNGHTHCGRCGHWNGYLSAENATIANCEACNA